MRIAICHEFSVASLIYRVFDPQCFVDVIINTVRCRFVLAVDVESSTLNGTMISTLTNHLAVL
jgi:hypothetical protein